MANQIFEIETNIGEPIYYEGGRLIPFSRSLVFRNPWRRAILIWNRPVAVLVKKNNGQDQVIPIIDVTRRWQVALLGGALLGGLLIRLGMHKHIR